MKRRRLAAICLVLMLILCGCGAEETGMQDGSYTAEMSEPSYGWNEYVTITVKDGEIVSTKYDAENASGFVKSWDNAYMNNMKPVSGTYPNEYTRYYKAQLTGQSDLPEIDALSGATESGDNFKKLAQAVVEQAMKGDSRIVMVSAEAEAE